MTEPIKTEQWETIKDFPDYAVSNFGRVKRTIDCEDKYSSYIKAGRILKPVFTCYGYLQVTLHRINPKQQLVKTIHRLVLEAFCSSCPKGKQCHHKNGNKTNNCIDNLEWVTASQNSQHSVNILGNGRGEKHGRAKLTNAQVLQIRELYATGICYQHQLAKQFGVAVTTINYIILRYNWKHI